MLKLSGLLYKMIKNRKHIFTHVQVAVGDTQFMCTLVTRAKAVIFKAQTQFQQSCNNHTDRQREE